MNQTKLLVVIFIFSAIFVTGAYFILGRGENSQVTTTLYKTTDNERPRVELTKTTTDLGKIKVSESKATEFIIRNIGQKPLQLSNIFSSCGCTVGQVVIDGVESEEFGMHSQSNYIAEIKPNQQGVVRVTYRPYVMPVYGLVTRDVYVSTNDPDKSKLTFQVKAFVE